MSTEIQDMGPIDYMVVEFPGGRMSGKALPLLVDLSTRGVVRILDLVFVRKLDDGSLIRIDVHDGVGDDEEDLKVFEGASSGLLNEEDIRSVSDVIADGSAAAMLVYENRWAAPLATALRRGGAQLVAGGRIPVQALLAALDATEARS
jgi:Family of unknown function (DUF6325)